MGKRKSRKAADSDIAELNHLEDDTNNQYEDEDVSDRHEVDDHSSDGFEVDDDDDESKDEMDGDERGSDEEADEVAQKADELEELEKEYRELRNNEQNLLKNLKRHKDEDVQKGQAVKKQRALWDKSLEVRFLLQKPFSSCNRLPQEPVRSLFCETDDEVSEAYSGLIASSKKTLDSILELQQALLETNPSITQAVEAKNTGGTKQLEGSRGSTGDVDEEWLQISQIQSRMSFYIKRSVDKWQRKAQVTSGAAAIKDKLHAFNQSISEQVAAYMRDPSKMINMMQQNRSLVAVFGKVPIATDSTKQEEAYSNGDPELLDDSEFYQQLLREFFETIAPSSSDTDFYTMKKDFYKEKKLQIKKRKIVDRRASKSRKIRYHVHEKIVNFMAPRPVNIPPEDFKLLDALFGLKSRKPATVA